MSADGRRHRCGEVRIGISGWRYAGWRGSFYPRRLRQKDELRYASSQFRSIEINGTFYGLLKPDDFARFHDETPDDFVFSVKVPRYLTHILRGRNVDAALANFLASGVLRLGRKWGPLLWQFPPSYRYQPEALKQLFATLPRDTGEAAARARRHESRVSHAWTRKSVDMPLRHAIEIRHESFAVRSFVELLREYEVALVCADTVEWPR